MLKNCVVCGKKLGLYNKLIGSTTCSMKCEEMLKKQEIESAKITYSPEEYCEYPPIEIDLSENLNNRLFDNVDYNKRDIEYDCNYMDDPIELQDLYNDIDDDNNDDNSEIYNNNYIHSEDDYDFMSSECTSVNYDLPQIEEEPLPYNDFWGINRDPNNAGYFDYDDYVHKD